MPFPYLGDQNQNLMPSCHREPKPEEKEKKGRGETKYVKQSKPIPSKKVPPSNVMF
jgi:hypothetical protein